ncbi:MAG: class I SAM-dependent methyltransferase [Proteobacteria bacterium]|nr:class I SAM-dependent methyltransferase [Pseudomonadota bacterium]
MMHVFTTVTDSYKHSAELALFTNMFRKALPADAGMTILNRGDRPAFDKLRKEIVVALEEGNLSEYILVAREPTVYIGKGVVSMLKDLLNREPGLDCAVPSDFHDVPDGSVPEYLSPRGFDRFSEEMRKRPKETAPFDGRDVFMFLIRTAALRAMDPPRDIFSTPEILGGRTAVALRAYIHPLFDYYIDKREDILPLILDGVQSVLDVGCTRGGFGAALKESRPCRVVGVEINPDEGKKALVRLDRVVIGDALDVDLGERFDCVTCLDVLEHFRNPERLLERIRDDFLCRDGGWLILSIPNVGHWSVVEDLLAGRWDYHPCGLLCNTHLRFFTLETIRGLLEDNGFQVEKIQGAKTPMPKMMKARMKELKENGMDIDFSSLDTLNYIILACKAPERPKKSSIYFS